MPRLYIVIERHFPQNTILALIISGGRSIFDNILLVDKSHSVWLLPNVCCIIRKFSCQIHSFLLRNCLVGISTDTLIIVPKLKGSRINRRVRAAFRVSGLSIGEKIVRGSPVLEGGSLDFCSAEHHFLAFFMNLAPLWHTLKEKDQLV